MVSPLSLTVTSLVLGRSFWCQFWCQLGMQFRGLLCISLRAAKKKNSPGNPCLTGFLRVLAFIKYHARSVV